MADLEVVAPPPPRSGPSERETPEPATTVESEERLVARRLRFREAVARLSERLRSTDLMKMVLLPGAILVIVGFNFIVFGWVGAARTPREIEQIPYLISGGLVGLGLVFVGALLLASAFWMALLRRFQEEADERTARQLEGLEERLQNPAPRRGARASGRG
jgi:hypothetical protein